MNSADPDQTAPDQDLHCLPYHLHLLAKSLNCETKLALLKQF